MSSSSNEASLDVVLYGRVGRNDHAQLKWQVARLREFAAASGYLQVTVLTEVSSMGPGQEVLDRVCAADVVVVWDASRLSRHREDFPTGCESLAQAGVEIVFADRPSGAAEHAWSGQATLVALIRQAVDQEQRAQHAEGTRRGIAAARARRAGQ